MTSQPPKTNTEIVKEIQKDNLVEDISRNIKVTPDYYDDFVQEMYLTLLEYDNAKLNEMYNKKQLKFFIVRICLNNWNSKTSPFYCRYKRPLSHIDGNADLTKLSDKI